MKSFTFAASLSLALPLTIGATSVFAATPITQNVYEGKIGNSAITLQTLETNDGKYRAANYFYDKYRLNINLLPNKNQTNNKSILNLNEFSRDCGFHNQTCKPDANLNLKRSGNTLSGVWKSTSNKKSYKVSLKLISSKNFNYDEKIVQNEGLLDLYSDFTNSALTNQYLRKQTSGVTTYSTKEDVFGPFGFVIATDKQTGVHYPSLNTAKININVKPIYDALNAQRQEMVGYALDCKAYTPKGSSWNEYGDWQDYEAKVVYATDKVIVTEEAGSTFCGGAHPNNTYQHNIFKVATGKILNVNDLFNAYDKDGYSYTMRPNFEEFVNKIKSSKSHQYPINNQEDGFSSDCINDVPEESLGRYNLWPSKDGIVFSLEELPHVMGACMGNYYVASYKELQPFMTPLAKKLFAQNLALDVNSKK